MYTQNIDAVSEFIKLSLDLGGFPLIEPVYDLKKFEISKDFRHLLTIQTELIV
jgi:hypothetical protein